MTRIRNAITDDNRRWWTLGAMCFALFMIMLDNTVVNVALPAIQKDLHSSISGLEWTVNAYTLSFAVLLVTGGRLGDIFGRRRMFLFGVVVFGLSSAFIGLSQSEAWLVAGRAAQGIGAAFMMPATLSIITNAFPAHERGKAIGTWAGVSALALAIGPVVGGFLVESVSWQSIFFLNVPVAIVAVVVTLAATRESRDESSTHHVDFPGVTAVTVGLSALVLALVEGNSWGWGSARIVGLLAISAIGLIAFAIVERRVVEPMVDFRFFRSRSFVGANLVAFIVSFAMLAMFFFLALYMQNIKGYSPLQAGVRFLPSTVVIILVAPIAGRLSDRIGPRPLITGGLLHRGRLALLAGPPRGRHELWLPDRRLHADGPRDGPRDVAHEHGRDERRRALQGGRGERDPDHEPHGRRHLRRRRHGRAHHRRWARPRSTTCCPRCPTTSARSWPTASAPAARGSAARWATPSTRPSSTPSTTACASAPPSPSWARCSPGC